MMPEPFNLKPGTDWMATLKPDVTQRLKALELIALWEGRLVTNRLCDWYGISRQQASADIKLYLSQFNPDALRYNATLRGYEPAPDFRPALSSGHINDYLLLLSSKGSEPMAQVMETHPDLAVIQLPDRAVQPDIVRELLLACRNPISLRIGYTSMQQPQPHQREIVPHTLIYTGFRWHVRAWCHSRQAFRDFVLSRMHGIPQATDTPTVDPRQDYAWHTMVNFRLIANPALDPAQRTLIARDYAMHQGVLNIRCRQALTHYTLQRYPAAISPEQSKQPLVYPLVVHPDDMPLLSASLFSSEVPA